MILQRGSGNPHRATTLSALGAGSPTSFDQVLADATKDTTSLASLELSIGFTTGGGGEVPGLSQRDDVFLQGERNPVAAYRRLANVLGSGTMDPTADVGKFLSARRSLLDFLKEDVSTFRNRLGSEEKPKLDLYLQALRDLEGQLGDFDGDPAGALQCSNPTEPDTSADFIARVNDMPVVNRLFMDVMALSLACGVTRVASIMWGGGQSDEPVRFNDISMNNWHSVSHGNPATGPGEQMIRMHAYLSGEFVYFVEKLKSFPDADGKTVLDNSVVVWGTQCGTSTQTAYAAEDHDRHNTPIIVAGSCGGAFTTGKVIDCDNRNHNDLYLAIAHAFGLNIDSVGPESWNRGPLPGLA
jgi:hypothetical protein